MPFNIKKEERRKNKWINKSEENEDKGDDEDGNGKLVQSKRSVYSEYKLNCISISSTQARARNATII